MRIKRVLACAVMFLVAVTAFGAAPAHAQEEPAQQEVSDEELYAATCINAGMLLSRFGMAENTEEAGLLDQAVYFWLQRHAALEPDEEARQQQWVMAAEMIVESTGEEPEKIHPALVVLMANCQARRADILRSLADPEALN